MTRMRTRTTMRAVGRAALIVILCKATIANSFAAWLKCYVDLTDTDEIVMNHRINANADALHSTIQIEVKRLDDDYWLDTIEFSADQATTAMARLKVPPELAKTDMQYAMDILTPGASFIQPRLCDGRRASASHYSSSVTFEISGETTIVELVAAYAVGHEAVTLTKTLILRRQETPEL